MSKLKCFFCTFLQIGCGSFVCSFLFFLYFVFFEKTWDEHSVSGHSRMYTSGYRRVNRRRLRTQSEDCKDDSQYTNLGTPPPVGECIRLVIMSKNTLIFSIASYISKCSLELTLSICKKMLSCTQKSKVFLVK